MAFDFPNDLGPRKMKVRLLSNVIEPESNGIGADQRFAQPGSKFAVDMTYPPMSHDFARRLIAALLRAETEETTVRFRQPGLSPAQAEAVGWRTFSAPSSANATVMQLGGDGQTVLGGQFFSVLRTDGRPYLHAVVQTNNIPGALVIRPPLRIPTSDALGATFNDVKLQGFGPKGVEWDVDEAHHYGLSFSIKERL